MARQLSTVCCVIIAAIILLPEAHSKVYETTYDAQRELASTKRYYLQYRSYRDDYAVPEAAKCVSMVVMNNAFGVRNAILFYKPTLQSQMKNKQVRITTHKAPGSRSVVDTMMRITDADTARQLYDQTLQYTDYRTCRVLVQQFAHTRQCSLWVIGEKRGGVIPASCSQAYTNICRGERHQIDIPGSCP
uniref:Putative salivary lipocalin n=1 Tax=Ixodes ricinus TaxID=34613 RepID=A0A0K8RIB9_IXORI